MPDRILVVDDEPDLLNLAKRILERKGFEVLTAVDGENGMKKAEAEMPDLILLDIVMPGKSGLEVCRFLKSQPKTKHIPVVLFTALGRDVDRKLGAEAGADGHFTKPFSSQDLLTEVKKCIDLLNARQVKFSRQLGVEHDQLLGKQLLLEFDPSAPYERLVRDFAVECVAHSEQVITLTRMGNAVRRAVDGDKDIELIDITPDMMFSEIVQERIGKTTALIYDNLSDLALSESPQVAYAFARNAVDLLSSRDTTAIFLLNPSAHDTKDTSSLRGLFSSAVTYTPQGITNVRIT